MQVPMDEGEGRSDFNLSDPMWLISSTHEAFNLFGPGPINANGISTLSNSDPDYFMRDIADELEAMFEYANNPFSFDSQHQSAFPGWETNVQTVQRPRTRLPDVTEELVSPTWPTSTNQSHSGQPARVAQVRPRSRSLPPTASRSPSPDTVKIPEPSYMKNEGREVPVVPLAHEHAAAAASNGDDGHPQSAATPTANGNAATATGPGNFPSNVLNNGVGQGQGMPAVGVAGVEQIRAVINTGFSHFMAHVNGKFAQVIQKLDAIERRQLSMSEERQRADERGNSSISAKLEELDKKFNDMHEELKALKPIVIDRVQVLAAKLDNVEAKVIETKQSIMETIGREQDKLKEIISSKMDPNLKDNKFDKSEPEPASSTLVVPMQAIDQHDLGAAAAALDVPVSSVSTSQGGSNNADNPENVGRKNAIIVVRRATNSLRGSASVPGVPNQKKRGNSNAAPSAPSELVSLMPSAPAPSAPTRRGRGRPSRKRSPSLNSLEAFEMRTGGSGVAASSLVIKDASNNGEGVRRGRPRIGPNLLEAIQTRGASIGLRGNVDNSFVQDSGMGLDLNILMQHLPDLERVEVERSFI